MLKFIHAADLHLDSPLKGLEAYEGAPVREVRRATRRAFENLVDLAIAEPVDFVLIAGDLFDGDWRDYNTGLFFVAQAGRLNAAGIPVFIVSGNHDAAGQMTRSLPYPDNVCVFSHRKPETRILDRSKVAVHGQSFAAAATMDNLARTYPEPVAGHFNIGLLHTSLTGREGHENYAPCSLDDLHSRGYDYWALGHAHQFEIVSRQPAVVFAGCTQGRHIRETGIKGCVLVTAAEGQDPEIVHQGLDVIRWERLGVDLAGARSLQEALERFREASEALIDRHDPLPVIVRVTFHGICDIHTLIAADPEHLRESVRSAAIAAFGDRSWVEKVELETAPQARHAPDPGPLKELDAFVASLLADGADLAFLSETLAGLMQKLPPDYRQATGSLRPDDPVQMRALVDQAHALLVRRLKQEAAAS
jgi:exonuclease SbcD